MTNTTTGKMSLLAAATLMAATVGMVPADAGGASNQHKCPNGQGIANMADSSAKQIKGECQQIKMESGHIKMQSQQHKIGGTVTINGSPGHNVVPQSTQIKQDAIHIKMDASQVKGDSGNQQQGTVTTAREAGSGMATGR